MRERYVVDTNVLIAASAADPVMPKDIDATPPDPVLRRQVWDWLYGFKESNSRLILDTDSKIFEEYKNKLGFNDCGIQVVMHKWSTAAVDCVKVEYDFHGHGVLEEPLQTIVHDDADRKMVGAAISANADFGDSCIAFAGDTDWHDWEEHLKSNGLQLEPIIEDWSRLKHKSKQAR